MLVECFFFKCHVKKLLPQTKLQQHGFLKTVFCSPGETATNPREVLDRSALRSQKRRSFTFYCGGFCTTIPSRNIFPGLIYFLGVLVPLKIGQWNAFHWNLLAFRPTRPRHSSRNRRNTRSRLSSDIQRWGSIGCRSVMSSRTRMPKRGRPSCEQ